jgi:hypothetical protein
MGSDQIVTETQSQDLFVSLQKNRSLSTQSEFHLPTQESIKEINYDEKIKKVSEGVIKKNKKKAVFLKFIEYKKMSAGEFFCGRVLLATDGILRHKIDKLKARLTIVT